MYIMFSSHISFGLLPEEKVSNQVNNFCNQNSNIYRLHPLVVIFPFTLSRNAPITAVENQPIAAKHRAL